MEDNGEFSLTTFERLAYGRKPERAAPELSKLLRGLDAGFGQLGPMASAPSGDVAADESDAQLAARLASAVTAFFADPECRLTDDGFSHLMTYQPWIAAIFGASGFRNGDHVIHLLNKAEQQAGGGQITLADRDALKFCLLYSLDSDIPLQPEALWQRGPRLAATFLCALLSSRLVLTEAAQEKREALLEWLPPRLAELALDDLPLDILHHVWMHCSYAHTAEKHAIKRSINELARAKLLALGMGDVAGAPPPRKKPVVLCVLEWFLSNHAIYRTHSLSLEALRQKYHVVGVSLPEFSDEVSRSVFDEVHVIPRASVFDVVRQVRDLADTLRPDIVYYPSVGMFTHTVLLANLRLAPIQIAALGHPATTHSPMIDYVVVEEDYLGEPQCFSERVVALPAAAIPYRPPADCPVVTPRTRRSPDPVRIAVAASVMKINARFLATLGRIAAESKVRVEFHFFSAAARGVAKVYLQNVVQRSLPGRAVVHPALPLEAYLQGLNACDMFVDPFPFGNTNGIVDTIRQGLPGVCLSGPEVHSRIDEGLFRRFGFPEWLIARSIEQYVSAAVRLAENSSEREELCRKILRTRADEVLFNGKPELFAQALAWLHATHGEHLALGAGSVIRPPLGAPEKPRTKHPPKVRPAVRAGRKRRPTAERR